MKGALVHGGSVGDLEGKAVVSSTMVASMEFEVAVGEDADGEDCAE